MNSDAPLNQNSLNPDDSSLTEIEACRLALADLQIRYNDLVNNSGEGLGMVDTNEIFIFANPAACEIFGLPLNKLIGSSLLSFLSPASVKEIEIQSALRKEGQKSIYELEIVRPDGLHRWIIVTATPQYDQDGKFSSTFGIFRDITQRKEAEDKLRTSEQRLHEIVDLTNDWIWEIDPAWRYIYVSPKVFDILGYRPDELIGKSPFEFMLPEDITRVQESIRSVVHQFKPLNAIVTRAKHQNGNIIYLETSGIPVFSSEGNYLGYRGADRDITLRILHETELVIAKEKAEESDRLKSSILANMSHELRTPLNGILGFSEILKEVLSQTEYESMADNIFNSGKRLMSTLNSIITLSQLEAGKITVVRKPIMLAPCIIEVVNSLEMMATEKGVYINTEGINSFSVITDESLLKELLLQIIDNAIKFTHHGGIAIETVEDSDFENHWIVIKISDTGIGIDKTHFEVIFQEFRQVSEGFGRKYQGSGIGLTISKKIIDLLDGRITIESNPGSGSCFMIWLPQESVLKSVHGSTLIPSKIKAATPKEEENTELPEVLLVEDNLVNKELTILFLKKICKIDYASNAQAALDMAQSKSYKAILIDINLGYGMNGLEATRILRNIPGYKTTPIIAVTGYTMAEDMERLYQAGCNYHVTKPFDKQTLQKLVQKTLAGAGKDDLNRKLTE